MTIKIEHHTPTSRKPMVLYDNVFLRGTVTVSSEVSGSVAANTFGDQTFDSWLQSAVPANVNVELPASEYVDCLCIDAHELGTSGSSISVEHSSDGSTWVSVGTSTPADNTALMVLFKPVKALWWRVVVSGAVANIGIIRLGYRLIFPTGLVSGYVPTNLARRIDVQGGNTIGGQFVSSRIIKRGADTSVTIASLDRDFVDTDMAVFNLHYDEAKAFFWAGGPEIFPSDLAFCKRPMRGGEIRPAYVEAGIFAEVSMNIEVYVNA